MTSITVDLKAVEMGLPMCLVFTAHGYVAHVGRTLSKITDGRPGAKLADFLRILHPAVEMDTADILTHAGRRLKVELVGECNIPEGEERSSFRAVVAPLVDGGAFMNFWFGADPLGAIQRHRLTAQDFAAADPTVDLLFVLEANSLVLGEFEGLSKRLDMARAAAEEEAITDKLTGLRNRRAMDLHLDSLTRQTGAHFGLMHLDLDYFKSINDTLGHVAGDYVLEQVAGILREEVRRGDMVARVGGDEFMLIFEDCQDVDLLKGIAKRIIYRLEQPMIWQGETCRISGSIGITMSSFYDPPEAERLVADADEALYVSKRAGRGRPSVATPSQAA